MSPHIRYLSPRSIQYGRYWGEGGAGIRGYAYSILPMEHGGYVLGGFGPGWYLLCTEVDPVDIPFELEAGEEEHDYEEEYACEHLDKTDHAYDVTNEYDDEINDDDNDAT